MKFPNGFCIVLSFTLAVSSCTTKKEQSPTGPQESSQSQSVLQKEWPHLSGSWLDTSRHFLGKLPCGLTKKFYFVYGNHFRPAPGRTLGLYAPGNYWRDAFVNYGFSGIAISGLGIISGSKDYDSAKAIGYTDANIMLTLSNTDATSNARVFTWAQGRQVKQFMFDEPLDRCSLLNYQQPFQSLEIASVQIAAMIPGGKMFMVSYKWPEGQEPAYSALYGSLYGYVVSNYANAYMMCDIYKPACVLGVFCDYNTSQYWNEFYQYYVVSGQRRSISNFMSASMRYDPGSGYNVQRSLSIGMRQNYLWVSYNNFC